MSCNVMSNDSKTCSKKKHRKFITVLSTVEVEGVAVS